MAYVSVSVCLSFIHCVVFVFCFEVASPFFFCSPLWACRPTDNTIDKVFKYITIPPAACCPSLSPIRSVLWKWIGTDHSYVTCVPTDATDNGINYLWFDHFTSMYWVSSNASSSKWYKI